MKHKQNITLTPEEALKLGVMRPISDQENLEPIVKEYMKYAKTINFAPATFVRTLLQIAYNSGQIEGIRAERARRR